jgi:hypothetical protein
MESINARYEATKNVLTRFSGMSFAIYLDSSYPPINFFDSTHMTTLKLVDLYNSYVQIDTVELFESSKEVISVKNASPLKSHWPCVYDGSSSSWIMQPDTVDLNSLLHSPKDVYSSYTPASLSFLASELEPLIIPYPNGGDSVIQYEFHEPTKVSGVILKTLSSASFTGILEYHDGEQWLVLDNLSGFPQKSSSRINLRVTETTAKKFRLIMTPVDKSIYIYVFKLTHSNKLEKIKEFKPRCVQILAGPNKDIFNDWGLNTPWMIEEAGDVNSTKPFKLSNTKSLYNGSPTSNTTKLIHVNIRIGELSDDAQ